jgi:hypothetical protein
MPTSDQPFDFRNLPAATCDSCRLLPASRRDLIEGPTIAIELGFLSAQLLPPLHDYVNVLCVQLEAAADALGQLGGSQRGAAAQEWLINQFSAFGVI